VEFFEAHSMEEAVQTAKQKTCHPEPVEGSTRAIVLLSTASPSYGMFKNFEEKGILFQKEIKK
jgi:UDP-N-acetylmuramoylalanine-D-glutamate ligase